MSNFSSTLPNPKLPCHIIPPSRNTGFFGRADVLEDLDKIFLGRSDEADSISSSGKELTMFALVGPGGMGKTQIATEFVHARKDRFDAIFWVYADQPVKVSEGFSKIAAELGLVPEDSSDAKDPVVIRENVKGWMARPVKSYEASETNAEKASWLLVFDNADNSEVIGDYWPVDGPGCVLLTSRYPLHLNGIEDKILQPFSPEEAFNFLIKLTKRKDDPEERQAGEEVARKLGGLPLAVTQMAGIITRRDLSFTEFLAAYDERESQEELFDTRMENPLQRRVSVYQHTLASVWALESLKHGRALLDVLSFLDPDEIPEPILTAFLSRKTSSATDPPLLHDYPRFYHESGSSLEALPFFQKAQALGEFVKLQFDDELSTTEESAVSIEEVKVMLAEIHHNIGCVATETNKPEDAVHHFTIFNQMMAEEARVNNKQKEYGISWNELGIAYMMKKSWKDAENCFLRSIEIMEEVDASAKELKSLPTVNLGLAYWVQDGRLEEADEVLMAGLRDREAIYGVNDRESFITGRFLHAIGNVKADLSKLKADEDLLDESRMYHQRALSHYRDTVGKNHHRTADTCVKVADHCIRLKMLDSAMPLLDQALKIFTGRPVYLPERARAMFKRSRVLELLGRLKEAETEKEESLKLLRELTDLGTKTLDEITDADFDEVIVFWSR
ncbi:putative tetratricopeptide repeat domain-containing protein [Neofusicoccum parvum]|nr:putative tetratricopeptide repeat domain-containing protein [Neofusicoccum parvum]